MDEEEISIMRITVNAPINVAKIADSGQCFRMNRECFDKYSVVHRGKKLYIRQMGDSEYEFNCSQEDFDNIWKDYFDLNNLDYYNNFERLVQKYDGIGNDFIRDAMYNGKGLVILNQDRFETLISFIISQQNRISKIKAQVEELASLAGKEMPDGSKTYFEFPTPHELVAFFKSGGTTNLGYRQDYVDKAAETVANRGIDWVNSSDEALTFRGVGAKVANCYSLYALHHLDNFPIDVWIQRVLDEYFDGDTNWLNFFNGYKGMLQLLLFYHIRHMGGKL